MEQEAVLTLRVRPSTARLRASRANFTDAIDLTPNSAPHAPQKPDFQTSTISPVTLTPSRRPYSPLPSSVPKCPRAMMLGQPSTPTKSAQRDQQIAQLASSESPRKSTASTSATPSPSKSQPLPPLVIPKRPKTVIEEVNDAATNIVLPIRSSPKKKEEVRCWGCGIEGHDMMVCKHQCGHCGLGGHNSIACDYRTLPAGGNGNMVLDIKLKAAKKEQEILRAKAGPLASTNPERTNLIVKAKASMERGQPAKVAKKNNGIAKGPLPKGPPVIGPQQPKYVRKGMQGASHDARNGLHKAGSEERKRRWRERSRSPGPYRMVGSEYHCETDRSPGRYGERRYHPRDYRTRAYEAGFDEDVMMSRTEHYRRGYIPEENGKWRREGSPKREELDYWR